MNREPIVRSEAEWKEALDPPRAIGVGLVVAGVVVLNLGGAH